MVRESQLKAGSRRAAVILRESGGPCVIFLFPCGVPATPKIALSSPIRPVSFAIAPRERPCGACSWAAPTQSQSPRRKKRIEQTLHLDIAADAKTYLHWVCQNCAATSVPFLPPRDLRANTPQSQIQVRGLASSMTRTESPIRPVCCQPRRPGLDLRADREIARPDSSGEFQKKRNFCQIEGREPGAC